MHIDILGCTTKKQKHAFPFPIPPPPQERCNLKNVALYDGLTREQIREPKALTGKGELLCKKVMIP